MLINNLPLCLKVPDVESVVVHEHSGWKPVWFCCVLKPVEAVFDSDAVNAPRCFMHEKDSAWPHQNFKQKKIKIWVDLEKFWSIWSFWPQLVDWPPLGFNWVRSALAFLTSPMFFKKKNPLWRYLRTVVEILLKFYIMDCNSDRGEIFVWTGPSQGCTPLQAPPPQVRLNFIT